MPSFSGRPSIRIVQGVEENCVSELLTWGLGKIGKGARVKDSVSRLKKVLPTPRLGELPITKEKRKERKKSLP